MLGAGDPAPDFDLHRPTADGSETYRLSAATREGPAVVAFYPLAETDAAATLLRDLAAADWTTVTDGLAVFGVGVGELADYESLASAVDVPFPLLLDDGFFADQYGVLEPVDDEFVRVRPSVFVVDRRCFVVDSWTVDPDAGLPLDEIKESVASV